jgi:hypothetical protein
MAKDMPSGYNFFEKRLIAVILISYYIEAIKRGWIYGIAKVWHVTQV